MDGWSEIDDSVWCSTGEIWMAPGTCMPLRTTLIRLGDGGFWLHSPMALDEAAIQTVQSVDLQAIVGPSGFHHLYLGTAQGHFPGARIWASPAIAAKQPNLAVDHWFGDAPPAWADEIEPLGIGGMPKVQEWVFFHHPSGTLIATDLVFNLRQTKGWLTPIFLTLFGTRKRFAQSRLFKGMIRDRSAYEASIAHLLRWPVKRVVMGHGEILEGDDVHGRLTRALGR